MRSLAQSPIAGKVQEKQGKDEEIVIENFDMPCSMQREIKTSTPDVQKGSMIEHYQEKMSLESPSSVDGVSFSNLHISEVMCHAFLSDR